MNGLYFLNKTKIILISFLKKLLLVINDTLCIAIFDGINIETTAISSFFQISHP